MEDVEILLRSRRLKSEYFGRGQRSIPKGDVADVESNRSDAGSSKPDVEGIFFRVEDAFVDALSGEDAVDV